MAEDEKTRAEVAATPATKGRKSSVDPLVASVFGDMVHAFTAVKIPSDGRRMKIDSWIEVQIEAGKLKILED